MEEQEVLEDLQSNVEQFVVATKGYAAMQMLGYALAHDDEGDSYVTEIGESVLKPIAELMDAYPEHFPLGEFGSWLEVIKPQHPLSPDMTAHMTTAIRAVRKSIAMAVGEFFGNTKGGSNPFSGESPTLGRVEMLIGENANEEDVTVLSKDLSQTAENVLTQVQEYIAARLQ